MQPHSACAISIANYIYNFYHEPHRARGLIRIEYQDKEGKFRSLIYTFSDVRSRGKDFREGFSVYVKKSGDPLSCVLTVSTYDGIYHPGKHFVITHGTQHRAGLEEHFDLYERAARNGRHLNSLKYGDFAADLPLDRDIRVFANLNTKKLLVNEKSHLVMSIKLEQIDYEKPVERKIEHHAPPKTTATYVPVKKTESEKNAVPKMHNDDEFEEPESSIQEKKSNPVIDVAVLLVVGIIVFAVAFVLYKLQIVTFEIQ